MRAGFTIDRAKFDAQLPALKRRLEGDIAAAAREVEEKIRQAAIFAAQLLAERTFPSPDAIGLAVGAMRFDIGRVFITAGKAYEKLKEAVGAEAARSFYAAYKRGDYSRALTILRAAGILPGITIGRLDSNLHEKSRNPKNGRVELAEPLQIVSKEELDGYMKKQIAEIGKTASGWNACAAKLGGSESVSRWKGTSVHGENGGSIEIEKTVGRRIVISLTNHRRLARKHISPGQLAAIRQHARAFLERLLAT